MNLTVTDAYEIENHVAVSKLRVGRHHRRTCGDDVIIDYHPTFRNGTQQHEVRMQPVMIEALQCVIVERNAESAGDDSAYLRCEMEPVSVPAPRRGDDTPIFRTADKCRDEFARGIGKHRGIIGR